MNLVKNNWPIVVLFLSTFSIVIALIAEHIFDILPCKMCLYQRYPYYFLIIFSFIFVLTKKIPLRYYYWLTEVSFAVGLFYAIWHVSIEQKILLGPSGCSNTIQQLGSLNDLKNQILNQVIISCDAVAWSIMGLSAATINSLLLILLLLFNTIFLIKNYYDKEKNN